MTGLGFRTETETVYNLTVDVAHTDYVGQAEPVLVHNSPCSPPDGDARDGGNSRPALRQAYEAEGRAIADETARLAKAGADPETIARAAWKKRRDIGIKYKNLTPPERLAKFYARNLERYQDKLGPTIEWFRENDRSWEQIAESSARPGGEDLDF